MTKRHHQNLTLIRTIIVGFGLAFISQHSIGSCFGQSSSHGQGDGQPMPGQFEPALRSTQVEFSSPQMRPKLKPSRVQQIHDRIHLLKSIIEAERKAAMINSSDNKPPIKPISKVSSPSQAPESPAAADDQTATLEPPKFVPSISADELTATLPDVTADPLDAGELAFSLYMTGNYSTAIKNLQVASKQEHTPGEAVWINCLMGCCYQMQQKFDDAERMFRKAAKQKSDAEIYWKYSSWKLQYIGKRRGAIHAMQVVDAELKQYAQEDFSGK